MHKGCRNRIIQAEILAALIKSPRTIKGLRDMTGAAVATITEWCNVLQASGLVHTERVKVDGKPGSPTNVYHWCPVPFEAPATIKGVMPD